MTTPFWIVAGMMSHMAGETMTCWMTAMTEGTALATTTTTSCPTETDEIDEITAAAQPGQIDPVLLMVTNLL